MEMEQLDIELIKKKAKTGVIALTSRTAIVQLIAYISTFLLTIVLTPEIFGVFIVVSAAVSFLRYFSDIGLAAALIQKKDPITDEDLKTTFTIQMSLVTVFVLLGLLLSNVFVSFYKLNQSGLWLFAALLIAFFLSSLKTIPSIILERKLDFQKFIIPEIVETSFFYLIVLFFAWRGYGITSFTLGVLARAISGLITIYIIAPWRPGFSFNRQSAKTLLRFGIPFQLNSFLALVKDDLLTLYLGWVIGFVGVSYVGWAKKWSEVPLRVVMDNINKVTFPTFSRLQHEKAQISHATQRSIYLVVLFTFPLVFTALFSIDSIVNIIPEYGKWKPALFSFYLFSLGVLFASLSSLLTNVIQALGKVKIVLKLMVLWTTLTWILVPFAIKFFGYNGVSMAMSIISLTSIIVIVVARQVVHFDIKKALVKPIIVNTIGAVALLVTRNVLPGNSIYTLVGIIMVAVTLYPILIIIFSKNELLGLMRDLRG